MKRPGRYQSHQKGRTGERDIPSHQVPKMQNALQVHDLEEYLEAKDKILIA